jgi:hypothetical protein
MIHAFCKKHNIWKLRHIDPFNEILLPIYTMIKKKIQIRGKRGGRRQEESSTAGWHVTIPPMRPSFQQLLSVSAHLREAASIWSKTL